MTVITPEQLTYARRRLGQQLAARREAAGLTQFQLARHVGYTRSTIANVETGRSSQPRDCWVRYDQLLRADGALLAGHDHYRALASRYRDQAAQERERQRTARIEQWRYTHAVADEGLGSRQAGGDELPVALGVRMHPTDGKAMAFVGEGAFKYGRDNQMVWLPAFWVDITPVTNIEYARFVDATGHRRPPHWPDGIHPDQLADHPVVNVTHTDATTYAAWAGKLLPSEQEWEKAARGPTGSTYPWGDQQTPAKCNVRETGVGATTPVGLYRSGVSPHGVYDLAGNVWEWCRTQTSPGRFVLKGSAFTSLLAAAAAAETNDAAAGMLDDDTGFRCVVPHDRMPPLVSG